MNKHTPGPWHVVPYGDGNQKVVCSDEAGNWRIAFMATSSGSREELAEIKANARLIAAAPELLEALKDLVTSVEALRVVGLDKEIELARAALSKAEGSGQ